MRSTATAQRSLDGFPDVTATLAAFNQPLSDPRLTLELKVCVYLPGPTVLAILDRHKEKWASEPGFDELYSTHNAEFNVDVLASNSKRGAEDDPDGATPSKKMRLVEDPNNTLDKVMNLPNPYPELQHVLPPVRFVAVLAPSCSLQHACLPTSVFLMTGT